MGLKICHIQHSFYPELGGMQTNTFETLKALAKNKQEVFIVTGKDQKNSFLSYEKINGINIFRGNKAQKKIFNVKVQGFDLSFIIWLLNMFKVTLKTVLFKKVDIIHAHNRDAAFIAYLVGKLTRRPFITEIHQYDMFCFRNGMFFYKNKFCGGPQIGKCAKCTGRNLLIFTTQFMFSRFIMNATENLIVPGKYVREIIKRLFPRSKMHIIPNGINHEYYKVDLSKIQLREYFKLKNEAQILLFVGRFVPEKGPHVVINSIPFIISKFNKIQVVLVGFGPLESYLNKLIEEKGISEFVKIIGKMENKEVKKIYRASDIFILSSIIPDPFPNVVLEAMVSGLPVICTNMGGQLEMVKNNVNGIIISPNNPKQLADAVLDIILNKKMEKMGQKSIELSQNFSWNKKAKDLISLYEEIIRQESSCD